MEVLTRYSYEILHLTVGSNSFHSRKYEFDYLAYRATAVGSHAIATCVKI